MLDCLSAHIMSWVSSAGKSMPAGLRQRTRCQTVSFSRQCEEAAVEFGREDRGCQTEERAWEGMRETMTRDDDQPPRSLEECVAVMKSQVRNIC